MKTLDTHFLTFLGNVWVIESGRIGQNESNQNRNKDFGLFLRDRKKNKKNIFDTQSMGKMFANSLL